MLTRALLAAVAVLCVVFGVVTLRDDARCTDARNTVLAIGAHGGGDPLAAAKQVRDECEDTTSLVRAATLLSARRHFPEALAIARQMIHDAPQDYVGWLTYAGVANFQHPGSARAAFARAHQLNPRGTPAP